jgi:hypothetical protein
MGLASITHSPACLTNGLISVSALKSYRFEEDLYECWNYHHRHQNAGQLYQ